MTAHMETSGAGGANRGRSGTKISRTAARRVGLGAAASVVAFTGLLAYAQPASAADQSTSGFCYKDGDNLKGQFYSVSLQVSFHQTRTGSPRTGDIDFRTFSTNGVASVKSISAHDYAGVYHKDFSLSSGVNTDNEWKHWTRYYRRGPGTLLTTLHVDVSDARDVSCTIRLKL